MSIVARRTLLKFVAHLAGQHAQPVVRPVLDVWFDQVGKAKWTSTADVKRLYATASIGTHRAYDKIDVKEIEHGS